MQNSNQVLENKLEEEANVNFLEMGRHDELVMEKTKISIYQRIFNISVLVLSSISFGYGLTSYGTVSNVVETEPTGYEPSLMSTLSIIANSNIFLGGLIANFMLSIFTGVSRKNLLMLASLISALSYLLQAFLPGIITVGLARILIGLSSGIVCSIVPGFLYDNSPKRFNGFIPGIHSIGISIGILVGCAFGEFNSKEMYLIPMISAVTYFALNTFLLFFVKDVKKEEEVIEQVGVFPLLRVKEARKSLMISMIFHLSQHLSGVDFVSMFSKNFMGEDPQYLLIFLTAMSIAIPTGIIGNYLLDKGGRKTMMLISCFMLCVVTAFIGYTSCYEILIYFFVISYNLGVANVPWVLPNDIFPKQYFQAGSMIGVTVNWFSAYLLTIFSATIYEIFGEAVWYFFSGSMGTTFIFTALTLTETKKNGRVLFYHQW